eukprot:CAMPEP_0171835110 /NCGR_PEP_ID=MMETSP0992-20121227/10794_1 /TAXON_ID=483369 /ORGANISM="non described non described, Strain CCMP2098" /LENGTH=295 /DNA_ID=CAMNT_0012450883 /DNA_START=448 /DNA_END=1335 /DNA_ORIENTATION=-
METQIVFRSASPIAVSILEYIFLERELPGRGCGERYYSKRALPFGHSLFCFLPQSRGDRVLVSCFLTPGCMFCACLSSGLALAGILASALAYVATDSEFAVNGFAAYTWISLYFVLICVSMTLGKHLMATTKVSVWGSVLLTNGLSLPLLALLSWARGEFDHFLEAAVETTPHQWGIVLAGCVAGTMIGWAGWFCRDLVSATSYTLIGVANKMLTVLLGVVFLDKHASSSGIGSLCMCIVFSTQYKQSPLRKTSKREVSADGKDDDGSAHKCLSGEDGDLESSCDKMSEKQRPTP